jgi:glycosyltransferase involved in cell wall biosynthesis
MSNPTVSIIMLAYNHEQYIAQAIEGVLAQEAEFDWELIIADDCSTDGTQGICTAYAEKDARVLYRRNDKNLGANANFLQAYRQCRGAYIALCEGDDYWIDPRKLHKQAAFLEAHRDYAICFHDVYELRGRELTPNSMVYEKDEFDIVDLAKGNFIHTPSVLFVNLGEKVIPDYFSSVYVGDYLLHMQMSRFGKIKLLAEKMAVYRIHAGGGWSTKKDEFIYSKMTEYLEKFIRDDFNKDVGRILKDRLIGAYKNLFQLTGSRKYLLRMIRLSPLISIKFLLTRKGYAAH